MDLSLTSDAEHVADKRMQDMTTRMYDARIEFNAVTYKSFKVMIEIHRTLWTWFTATNLSCSENTFLQKTSEFSWAP